MITIIGAGISGLTLAYYLKKAGLEYILLEAGDTPGGNIKTNFFEDCILETGPNSLLCDDEIFNFLKELNLEEEIVHAQAVNKNRFIYKNGKYRKLPSSPVNFLLSSFFSLKTKGAILLERFKKPEEFQDETLEHFITRRFNKEISDYALNPFVSGIYAGDPKQLLISETFPVLLEYEQKYGSVLKGLSKSGTAERKQTVNFKKGMQALPKALAGQLEIKYNHKVLNIKKAGNEYRIHAKTPEGHQQFPTDKVVVCTPAFACLEFLKEEFPSFSEDLKKIQHPPMAMVHSAYKKLDIGKALQGFGGLNPKIENRFTAGSIWNSSVFEGRCFPGLVLFTSFVGGSQYVENARQEDHIILYEVQKELAKDFSILSKPVFQKLSRWEYAIPQYDKNIKSIRNKLKILENEALYFCSNWIGGISIPDCIGNAKKTAEKLIK